MTTNELEEELYRYAKHPMSAVQIQGFFVGLLAAPGDPEPRAWVEELLRADVGLNVSRRVFQKAESFKRLLLGIIETYNPIAEAVANDTLTLPFRTEKAGEDDRYQASRWAEAFWRGFVLADGDDFVREDEHVRQAMIIPLIIRDPRDALSEVEFEIEPTAEEISEFATQQLTQLPNVIRLVTRRARERHSQTLDGRRRRKGNGEGTGDDPEEET